MPNFVLYMCPDCGATRKLSPVPFDYLPNLTCEHATHVQRMIQVWPPRRLADDGQPEALPDSSQDAINSSDGAYRS